MLTCTSAANFLNVVGMIRRQVNKLLMSGVPLHSYRGMIRDLANTLYQACDDFGQGPACEVFEASHQAALDALAFLNIVAASYPIDKADLQQAYEFLCQVEQIGGAA